MKKRWLLSSLGIVIIFAGAGWYAVAKMEQAFSVSVVSQVLANSSKLLNGAAPALSKTYTANLSPSHPGLSGSATSANSANSASQAVSPGSGSTGAQVSGSSNPSSATATDKGKTNSQQAVSGHSSGGLRQNTATSTPTPATTQAAATSKTNVTTATGATPTPAKADSSPAANGPDFTSRQQVINYTLSHFTTAQILHFAFLYLHRASLSAAQIQKIKNEILSHFTPAELLAMQKALQKYP